MAELRKIFHCARLNFIKWWRDPATSTIALCWFLFVADQCSGLREYCAATNSRVSPWVLPLLLGDNIATLMFISMLIIFFAHAPFCNQHAPFTLIRTGKRSWFLGQVGYIIGASLVAVLFTYGSMLIALLPRLGFSLDWGGVLQTLGEHTLPPDQLGIQCSIDVNLALLTQYTALEATVLTFLMMWSTCTLVGCTVLFFNVLIRPGAGVIAGFLLMTWSLFTVFGGSFFLQRMELRYTSILHWSSLNILYPMDKYSPPPSTAALIQLTITTVFIVVSVILFCRKDTQFETDHY